MEPAPKDLRSARTIGLARDAGTDSARALVAEVVELITPHLKRTRSLGQRGRETQRANVAAILAGVLKPAFRGRVVAAQRRPGAGMWDHSLIGNRAFWGLVDALRAAGLLGYREGSRGMPIEWDPGEPIYSRRLGGQPSKLWPIGRLMELASQHGVSAETVNDDWPICKRAEGHKVTVPPERLVICHRVEDHLEVEPAPGQAAEADSIRADLKDLNDRVAAADIRGCLAPAFRRVFGPDLRLGGRYYALGSESFQVMSEAERSKITIDGSPVVEVDIHACNLTIFLALTGTRELPKGDLYDHVGLPPGTLNARTAVKQWVVQSFGSGKPACRWARNSPEAAKRVRPSVVRDAALQAYPSLRDLSVVVPVDLAVSLPSGKRCWAVGQYLTNWESRIMQGALGYLRAERVLGLPMHDALIVPAEAARFARQALEGAFFALLGVIPKLH